ncbi:GNAT family N-acetyltransferase [Mumia zhuanghuii]|uniref:GNAT family N-acetyltransferase n=2 Tax=Mumia TaxID=1546255 RepID=A0ABW1QHH1_9ACTN|nr:MULTISPECIES: GNAT family N-acetyltransferase [Mumia]KAA1422702.1 GNAT family N-acetyltransferase [Mumia zhuanghuii]
MTGLPPRTTLALPLHTDRLSLRPYALDDAPRVLDVQSRHDVIRWLGDPPYVPMETLDQAQTWINDLNALPDVDPRCIGLAVEAVETGVVVGTIMLTTLPKTDPVELQVGWHLHPDSIGHGYATEAARALFDAAYAHFDGSDGRPEVDRVWCDMFADNHPSAAVAVRLGLRDTGIRDDPWYDGEGHIFVTTRADWTAGRGGRPVR